MPLVSILIPAVKPDHLVKAIISAARQSVDDIEILVGDDTPDASLQELVAQIDDQRVRYLHHGLMDYKRNVATLWRRSDAPFVKWLHDDDVLLPPSVEVLLNALRKQPHATLAFHGRVYIDGKDAIRWHPGCAIKDGETANLSRPRLVREMVGRLYNCVGEVSNVMQVRDRDNVNALLDYRGWPMDCLHDVALFLNAAEHAPILGVGGLYSACRLHRRQLSWMDSPYFSAFLYEWELLVRGEGVAKMLSRPRLLEAKARLHAQYGLYADRYPEFAPLIRALDEIERLPATQLLSGGQFAGNLARARAAMKLRVGSSKLFDIRTQ